MHITTRAALAASLFAAATPLLAQLVTAGPLRIDQPWSRQTAPGQKAGGGFLNITNQGRIDDRLIAASSPIANEVQIHRMTVEDGVMKMRQMTDGLALPAGKTVALKPGGYHLMFMGLKRPLELGDNIPVTLRFQRQGAVTVRFKVRPITATSVSGGRHD
ncbi:MAG: copper chaperone PCu(A)C [Sphingopyxis sp.]|uniref:copper chaperone PCu(A)C n=1 Tax=Sphingopyxis sp. TaxID=1908224 RepID=UPI002AB95104|nr:copper chaperone PCu(A)C [Sphingopyxis sp.]MDZ3830457.1 copper chaperone PCu(A)C [Sphingopyxis sp.]